MKYELASSALVFSWSGFFLVRYLLGERFGFEEARKELDAWLFKLLDEEDEETEPPTSGR